MIDAVTFYILISVASFIMCLLSGYCLSLRCRLKASKYDCKSWGRIYEGAQARIRELESSTPTGLIEKLDQAKRKELKASKEREEAVQIETMAIAQRQELEAKLQLIERPSAFRSLARLPEGQRTMFEEEPQRRKYNMGGEKENT